MKERKICTFQTVYYLVPHGLKAAPLSCVVLMLQATTQLGAELSFDLSSDPVGVNGLLDL